MSRTVLVLRSLMTDSFIVQTTMILFALVCIGFIFADTYYPSILFLGCCLAGVGYKTRRYFASERRRLVPGLNEETAIVAIALWAICCVLGCTLVLLQFTSSPVPPEAIGGCCLGLAFALWVGCIEKSAIPALILLYVVPVVISLMGEELSGIGESYGQMPFGLHFLAGVVLFVLATALVVRFYFILTSPYSPFVDRGAFESDESGSKKTLIAGRWLVAMGIASVFGGGWLRAYVLAQHGKLETLTAAEVATAFAGVCGSAAIIATLCVIFYKLSNLLLCKFIPDELSVPDVSQLLYGKVDSKRGRFFFLICGCGFVLTLFVVKVLFVIEENLLQELMAFGIVILPFFGGAMLMFGVPIHYSRLWVSGVAEDRVQTALIILVATVTKGLFIQMIAVFCLLSTISVFSGNVWAFVVLSILAVGVGAIPIWIVSRWYAFWCTHKSSAIVAFSLLSLLMTVGSISSIHGFIKEFDGKFMSSSLEILTLIVLSVAIAILLWSVCIFNAARSLGNSSELLECESQLMIQ